MNVYHKDEPKESAYENRLLYISDSDDISIHTAIEIAVESLRDSMIKYFNRYNKFPDDMSCEVDVSGKDIVFNCHRWFEAVSLPVSASYNNMRIELISENKVRIEYIPDYEPVCERKRVFIINGVPKAGKDTLIQLASKDLPFNVVNTSTIDIVKDIATQYDLWDGVNKTDDARNMLSELKRVITKYSNCIINHICRQVQLFLEDNTAGAMFIHCREPKEINRLRYAIVAKCRLLPTTLVVRRSEAEKATYGNESDANVLQYNYDLTFHNDSKLEDSVKKFAYIINKCMQTALAMMD